MNERTIKSQGYWQTSGDGMQRRLRNKLFWKHYGKKGKIIDLSLLPPCSSSLRKQSSRAYYVAALLVQNMDSFSNYCWFADGSLDWIDCPYPSDVTDLFDQKDDAQGDESDLVGRRFGRRVGERRWPG